MNIKLIVKNFIKGLPFIGAGSLLFARKISQRKKKFKGSEKYWESRYVNNGNSGPGSYGVLAVFKSEIINSFVSKNNIESVIELGCGDGNQLELGNYKRYIGLDVSKQAIAICKKKFKEDNSKSFELYNTFFLKKDKNKKEDLSLSLDVLFHLIEDDVYEQYLHNLFKLSSKFVIIYSSNFEQQLASHVRCRKFTDWVDKNKGDEWKLTEFIKNKYPYDANQPNTTSFADFYIYRKISN